MDIISRIRTWLERELDKLRPMTLRAKFNYIASYYTGWIVLFLIICLFIGFAGDAVIQSRKEIILQGFFTNDDLNYFPGSQMEKDYAEILGLSRNQRIVFDDSLYFDLEGNADEYTAASNGKVIATMAVNQLDFMVTTEPVLKHFEGQLPMKDLEKFLPDDILEAVQGSMISGLDENGNTVLVGINMNQSRYLKDFDPECDFYLFIPYNIPNEEHLVEFLRYAFCWR